MIRIATISMALASTVVAQPGAQRSPSPNIAVVNLTAVFDRYQMTRDLEQLFDERRQSVGAEAQKKRDDINMQRNALRDVRPGTADFTVREDDLIRAEVEFQAWLEIHERRLKNQHKNWLQAIYADAQAVVARLAAERGIDLVLTFNELQEDAPDSMAFKQQILLRSVLYASDRVDLTARVLEMLDAEYQRRGGAATLQTRAAPPTPAPPPNTTPGG